MAKKEISEEIIIRDITELLIKEHDVPRNSITPEADFKEIWESTLFNFLV